MAAFHDKKNNLMLANEWFHRGLKAQEPENKLYCYNRSLGINPYYIYAWNSKGNVLYTLGRFEEALECYDKALELNYNFVEAWGRKGNTLRRLGKNVGAIKCYDKSISFFDDDPYVWNGKGDALSNLGKYKDAIKCYDRAIKLKKDLSYPWSGRGFALHELGFSEEAVNSFDQAIKINPIFHYAWFGRGNSLLRLERYEEAINCYENVLKVNPKFHGMMESKIKAENCLKNKLSGMHVSIEEKMKELSVNKAFAEGKGSRYVKLEEVKQYELNFIGRLEHKLGDTVTFSGKTYKIENLNEIKQEDTSRLGKIHRLSERDLKNLPENRSLVGKLTEKKLLGKKQRYNLKALFYSRVEKYAKAGYDTDPLELKDLNACLVDSRDEAKGKGECVLLCLASPTGFETTVDRHISSEDFHRNFLSRYLSVCLLDLETGKQLYNPNDEVAKEFAKLCELETDREKSEKLKISVRKTIENGLLLKDFVVLGDIAKSLGNDAAVKPAFYEYADEKGLNVKFVEDVGLVMMK